MLYCSAGSARLFTAASNETVAERQQEALNWLPLDGLSGLFAAFSGRCQKATMNTKYLCTALHDEGCHLMNSFGANVSHYHVTFL